MKKFKFTLQTVHKVRELKSEQENLTLVELRAQADEAARRIDHIEELRTEAVESYLRRVNSGQQLNPFEMQMSASHFASLNAMQKDAQIAANEKQEAVRRQLEAVKTARAEVKVTDKLREGQKKRHELELNREEQSTLDELVTTEFARRVQEAQ